MKSKKRPECFQRIIESFLVNLLIALLIAFLMNRSTICSCHLSSVHIHFRQPSSVLSTCSERNYRVTAIPITFATVLLEEYGVEHRYKKRKGTK